MTDKITNAAEAIEAAARIVEQCNREGPYNAVGAAARIRALSEWIQPAVTCGKSAAIGDAYGLLWNMRIDKADGNLALASAAREALERIMTQEEKAGSLRIAMATEIVTRAKRLRQMR